MIFIFDSDDVFYNIEFDDILLIGSTLLKAELSIFVFIFYVMTFILSSMLIAKLIPASSLTYFLIF